LDETFKKQYAELWRAIFQLDIKTLERITTEWGMGKGSAELFASATLMRPWKKPKTKEEAEVEAAERGKRQSASHQQAKRNDQGLPCPCRDGTKGAHLCGKKHAYRTG
jgi:aarF domain-containing kinase